MKLFDVLVDQTEDLAALICNITGDYIENKSELPKMLEHIGYIDNIDDVIAQVNNVEIMFPDNWEIVDYKIVGDEAKIDFQMDFIQNAFADSFVMRIQGWLKANVTFKNCKEDIQDFDPDDYEAYSELFTIDKLDYCDIEVDMTY